MQPALGAAWTEVAGAYAMFDGPESPITQTFGLGMFDPVGDAEMERVERFFIDRGAGVHHEVSPMAPAPLLDLLNRRGYRPIELSSVLYRPIEPGISLAEKRNPALTVRLTRPGEEEAWARTAAAGWMDVAPGLEEFMLEIGRVNAVRERSHTFLAELDGTPVAAGAFSVCGGVALLAGASPSPRTAATAPSSRCSTRASASPPSTGATSR